MKRKKPFAVRIASQRFSYEVAMKSRFLRRNERRGKANNSVYGIVRPGLTCFTNRVLL